ncbi:MAG TPA: L-threonylcarbamoyladenylate synthase [Acidimicrobiales bacterium]|jgi:L-threonylcarbamoyladenylate synthase|nr:L-threonylcarbamoyladenylate synthase [Acidimicrobiales bacterium]
MIVPAVGDPPPPTAVLQAVRALGQALPVGIPTDTVYGLAVDPFRPGATDRIFAAKRRPRDVSLPLLVTGVEQALSVATAVPDLALELMAAYWPGPLTIVLPARPDLGADLGEDELTVGVRSPAHLVAQALCAAAGPLATTSANLHGQPPLTTAEAVAEAFGAAVPVVLDAGACTGTPSTVVDCTGHDLKLLREGRIPWAELLARAGTA